jgi:hypothetical protein
MYQHNMRFGAEFTYHGAVHEDPKAPVLLHIEGRYSIRGSVFSIIVLIWSPNG